jgi:hypothetical protein
VRAEIATQLRSVLPLRHAQLVIAKLEKEQNAVTRYPPGYAPARAKTPSTGVPDTAETTTPET